MIFRLRIKTDLIFRYFIFSVVKIDDTLWVQLIQKMISGRFRKNLLTNFQAGNLLSMYSYGLRKMSPYFSSFEWELLLFCL
jgi:hypothetical protein